MKARGALSRWGEGTGRLLERVLEARQESEQDRSLCSKESARERDREKERKKDMGTQALMEQRCFNDLSVSIYRLLYKKFLSTMIKIRKPNI